MTHCRLWRRSVSILTAVAALLALAGCATGGRGPLPLPEDYPAILVNKPGTRLIPTLYTPYPLESGAISVFSAMCEGPDGAVYSGSCCYDDWAKVFRQRPGADALDTVLNVGVLAGQLHYPTEHHSKIHTQLTLGTDGWIYGGSKRGNEFFNERALYGASEFQYPGVSSFASIR